MLAQALGLALPLARPPLALPLALPLERPPLGSVEDPGRRRTQFQAMGSFPRAIFMVIEASRHCGCLTNESWIWVSKLGFTHDLWPKFDGEHDDRPSKLGVKNPSGDNLSLARRCDENGEDSVNSAPKKKIKKN